MITEEKYTLPDFFTFTNGRRVLNKKDFESRVNELLVIYQDAMYGKYRDGFEENVSYQADPDKLSISIEKNGVSVDFSVTVSIPDESKIKCPESGWPVMIAFGWLSQVEYANSHGYAVIILNPSIIAADNLSREGIFYRLYPYGEKLQEQTGVLMAWGWGISKVLDALFCGAGTKYKINPENNIATGVSRFGKAVAVAAAFDTRIKVCVPACSGAAGIASFRYLSEGHTYDLSSVGGPSEYTMTKNEPLSCLQSMDERHWFNDGFLQFKSINDLPFDQHMLACLCATKQRFLFIIAAYQSEDWVNAPAMYLSYLKAKECFDFLDLSDHIAVHMHREGHAVVDEDMIYLIDYCNLHFYGIQPENDLSKLSSTIYALDNNKQEDFERLLQ